ncbi:helix-turn-helix domain-containing protein, partial [Candidatus Saccharibacteria bacterium]|nr:helix-turn-helix domain-containing protein [Candidatus Saccharibacteria bacterium]
AKRLRLSERQIKRLRKRVISEGIDGIRHGNKGHPSSGSVPEEMKQQIASATIIKTTKLGGIV